MWLKTVKCRKRRWNCIRVEILHTVTSYMLASFALWMRNLNAHYKKRSVKLKLQDHGQWLYMVCVSANIPVLAVADVSFFQQVKPVCSTGSISWLVLSGRAVHNVLEKSTPTYHLVMIVTLFDHHAPFTYSLYSWTTKQTRCTLLVDMNTSSRSRELYNYVAESCI